MLTRELCKAAFVNGSLDFSRIDLGHDFEAEDFEVIRDFIANKKITSFYLSVTINEDNYKGLKYLAQGLEKQHNLTTCHFAVKHLDMDVEPTGMLNPIAWVVHWLETRRLHSMQEAMNQFAVKLSKNKPHLTDLKLTLDNPGLMSRYQSGQLAKALQAAALKNLEMNLPVRSNFQLSPKHARSTSLNKLSFGHSRAGLGILTDLALSKHLEELRLHDLHLSSEDANNLEEVIRHNAGSLKKLGLINTGLSSSNLATIANSIQECRELKTLDLTGNIMSSATMNCIANLIRSPSSKINKLNLGNTFTSTNELNTLLPALGAGSLIKALNLDGSMLDLEGYTELLEQLLENKNLTRLSLRDLGRFIPSDQVVSYLTDFLKNKNCPVRHLKFSGFFSEESLFQLKTAILQNSSLESLEFEQVGQPDKSSRFMSGLSAKFDTNKRAHVCQATGDTPRNARVSKEHYGPMFAKGSASALPASPEVSLQKGC